MTRDDLYGYYRRYYVPNNATLVIVGDVDTEDVLRRGGAALRRDSRRERCPRASLSAEPEQIGERRVTIEKEGTTAYLKLAYHAPGGRPTRRFFPLLVLDAVLTGAKGLNLWSSFRTPPPQRSARLYRALVDGAARVVGVRRAAADRASRSSTPCRSRRPTGAPLAAVGAGGARGDSTGVRARGHHRRASWRRPRPSCARGWCSRTTA